MSYVILDSETGELAIELPLNLEEFKPALERALTEAFFGEPQNQQTAVRMEAFIQEWLKRHAGNQA